MVWLPFDWFAVFVKLDGSEIKLMSICLCLALLYSTNNFSYSVNRSNENNSSFVYILNTKWTCLVKFLGVGVQKREVLKSKYKNLLVKLSSNIFVNVGSF